MSSAAQGAVTPGYHADRNTVIRAEGVAAEFLEHPQDEQQHADQVAARITQLGGAPDFSPDGLATRSHAEYVEGDTLDTRRLMEEILAKEEHADDLANLLEDLGSR